VPIRTMNAEVFLTILFADIAQSTRLYEVLGDQSAQNLISTCLGRLSEVTVLHRGTVIKTIGDEVMCTFPEAREAVEAARAMHASMEKPVPAGEGRGISPNLHVGLHAGRVIREGSDVFGDAVNVAARLVKLAKQRQILMSKTVMEALAEPEKASVRFLGRIPVRGKTEEIPIYEWIWEACDMTIIADHALIAPVAEASMELRFGDQRIQIGPPRPTVTIGRDKNNDFVFTGTHVSRSHARIEYRGGTFLLSDKSSNGTYLSFQNGEFVHLLRDQIVLYGSGAISPGVKAEAEAVDTIHFQEAP